MAEPEDDSRLRPEVDSGGAAWLDPLPTPLPLPPASSVSEALLLEQERQPRIPDGTTNTWQSWLIACWPAAVGATLVLLYQLRLTGGPSWLILTASLIACVILADIDANRFWDGRLAERVTGAWWAVIPPLYLFVRGSRFRALDMRAFRPFWFSTLLLVMTVLFIERALPIILRLQEIRR